MLEIVVLLGGASAVITITTLTVAVLLSAVEQCHGWLSKSVCYVAAVCMVLYGMSHVAELWSLYVQEQDSPQQTTVEQSTGQNTHFTHQDHELRCRSKYNPNWGPCWRL